MISPSECHGRITWHGRPPAGTHPMVWHWRARPLAALYLADLGEQWANTAWTKAGPLITLHVDLTENQRNVAMAHELHHIAAGGVCRSHCPQNEAKVVRATARWLLPDVEAVADALRRRTVGSAAADLGVTAGIVFDRIRCLTVAERKVFGEAMRLGPAWTLSGEIVAGAA